MKKAQEKRGRKILRVGKKKKESPHRWLGTISIASHLYFKGIIIDMIM